MNKFFKSRLIKCFLCTLLFSFIFCSCNIKSEKEFADAKEREYTIINIDSCEYIFMSEMPFEGTMTLAHKGNCKYCIVRKKIMIQKP